MLVNSIQFALFLKFEPSKTAEGLMWSAFEPSECQIHKKSKKNGIDPKKIKAEYANYKIHFGVMKINHIFLSHIFDLTVVKVAYHINVYLRPFLLSLHPSTANGLPPTSFQPQRELIRRDCSERTLQEGPPRRVYPGDTSLPSPTILKLPTDPSTKPQEAAQCPHLIKAMVFGKTKKPGAIWWNISQVFCSLKMAADSRIFKQYWVNVSLVTEG